MIPFFHASGHNNYVESAHICLQDVINLERQLDDMEFGKFVSSVYFSPKRSDQLYCGLYTNQIIKQVLILGIQSNMVQRGITESVISKWISSSVPQVDIINSLVNYCNADMARSKQHIEPQAPIQINQKYLLILKELFDNNEPFSNILFLWILE